MSIPWHQWQGEGGQEYDFLESFVGKDHIRPMPSINWKVETVQVLDDKRGQWVRVRPGDYVLIEDEQVVVTSG